MNKKTRQSLREVIEWRKQQVREARALLGIRAVQREMQSHSTPAKGPQKRGPMTKGTKSYYGSSYTWNPRGAASTINAVATDKVYTRVASAAEESRLGTLRRGFRGEWVVVPAQ